MEKIQSALNSMDEKSVIKNNYFLKNKYCVTRFIHLSLREKIQSNIERLKKDFD